MDKFTIVDGDRTHTVHAGVSAAGVRLAPDVVSEALGWTLEAEGLCRGGVCLPVRSRDALVAADGIDLEALAAAIGRPLALDTDARAAALGVAAAERAAALASLEAPDFELPDLAGRTHTLSEHRGKKVLLIAYASW